MPWAQQLLPGSLFRAGSFMERTAFEPTTPFLTPWTLTELSFNKTGTKKIRIAKDTSHSDGRVCSPEMQSKISHELSNFIAES